MYCGTRNPMNTSVPETGNSARTDEGNAAHAPNIIRPSASRVAAPTFLAIPVAASVAFAVHLGVSKNQPVPETHSYSMFLGVILVSAFAAAVVQLFWPPLKRWMRHMCPIITAAVLLMCLWEVITSGFHLLPLPYFPSPAGVLQSLINDRALLFDSTWHSLLLLLSGYA